MAVLSLDEATADEAAGAARSEPNTRVLRVGNTLRAPLTLHRILFQLDVGGGFLRDVEEEAALKAACAPPTPDGRTVLIVGQAESLDPDALEKLKALPSIQLILVEAPAAPADVPPAAPETAISAAVPAELMRVIEQGMNIPHDHDSAVDTSIVAPSVIAQPVDEPQALPPSYSAPVALAPPEPPVPAPAPVPVPVPPGESVPILVAASTPDVQRSETIPPAGRTLPASEARVVTPALSERPPSHHVAASAPMVLRALEQIARPANADPRPYKRSHSGSAWVIATMIAATAFIASTTTIHETVPPKEPAASRRPGSPDAPPLVVAPPPPPSEAPPAERTEPFVVAPSALAPASTDAEPGPADEAGKPVPETARPSNARLENEADPAGGFDAFLLRIGADPYRLSAKDRVMLYQRYLDFRKSVR